MVDQLARGMSWPIRSSDVAAAFESRIDPQIWLRVWRRDHVKEWSKRGAIEQFSNDVVLVEIYYELRWVMLWSHHRASGLNPPAWIDMDPPPVVNCYVNSLPASVMRDAKLTKKAVATEVIDAIRTMCPPKGPITAHDWRVTLRLDSQGKRLIKRLEHKPIKEWEIVREIAVSLEEDH